jgi:hypothetical protein
MADHWYRDPRTPLPPPSPPRWRPPPPRSRDTAVIALIFAIVAAIPVMLFVITLAALYRP